LIITVTVVAEGKSNQAYSLQKVEFWHLHWNCNVIMRQICI